MEFENTEVFNFKGALRGMRNPMNSWDKSDSLFYIEPITYIDHDLYNWAYDQLSDTQFETEDDHTEAIDELCGSKTLLTGIDCIEVIAIGKNDMALAKKLIAAGPEHRKFLRQIFVSVDITAPLHIWKEFDTYKVGTVANSCSTMHKLASTPIALDCFEIDDLQEYLELNDKPLNYGFEQIIAYCEDLRQKYLKTNDKRYWKELVRWLPESWLQKRTVTMNYENLRNIYHQRKNHKLAEWHSFCKWIETLPYAQEFIIS